MAESPGTPYFWSLSGINQFWGSVLEAQNFLILPRSPLLSTLTCSDCGLRSLGNFRLFLRLGLLLRFAFFLAFAGELVVASPRWIRVTTTHFEMYTTNSEKQAVRALQGFEQVISFFLQNSKNKQAPEGRVRIIAFSSEKEYKPYRASAGAFAYYLQSRERDYIVMQDIAADHQQTAVHEYPHLIVRHTKCSCPSG
jgi:hypothetical protein